MLSLRNKSNGAWSWTHPSDMDKVCCEDGTEYKLNTSMLLIERGQNQGRQLKEIDDRGYLNWMLSLAKQEKDIYLEHCINKRLDELV